MPIPTPLAYLSAGERTTVNAAAARLLILAADYKREAEASGAKEQIAAARVATEFARLLLEFVTR